jgi:hypothetical protein
MEAIFLSKVVKLIGWLSDEKLFSLASKMQRKSLALFTA